MGKGLLVPIKEGSLILLVWFMVKWRDLKEREECKNKESKQEQEAKKMRKEPVTSQKQFSEIWWARILFLTVLSMDQQHWGIAWEMLECRLLGPTPTTKSESSL